MLSKKPDRCPECDRLLLSVDGKFDVGDKQHLPRTNFTCPNCGWKCTVKA